MPAEFDKCLEFDPFEGDFGEPGDHTFHDRLVVARKERDRLSTQGGEVPPLTQEDAHKELLRVSRENTYNGAEEAAFWNGYEFAQSRARPAPPHPDTVEVSREEWTIAQLLANAWTRHTLTCSERDKLVSEWDALRSGEAEGRKG